MFSTSSNNTKLVGILGLATVLRVIYMNQSLWLDEAISAKVVQAYSYSDIVTKFAPADFHPPLYYLVLKMWTSLFSTSEIGLRSLSVVIGVLSVYVVYKIAKLVWNQSTALIASLLFATAPLHIYYSQEARMYAQETLLVLVSVYFFLKLRAFSNKKNWIIFTVINSLIIYTDYLPALLVVVYFGYCLFISKNERRQFVFKLGKSVAVTLGTFSAFLPLFWQQLNLGHQAASTAWGAILGPASVKAIALVVVKFLIGRIAFDANIVYGLVILIGIGLYGFAASRRIRAWDPTRIFIVLWLVVPIILCLLISVKMPVFDYFRLLFVLPALYLLAARGVQHLSKRWALVVGIMCVVFNLLTASVYYFNPRFHREDWRGAVRYIEQHSNYDAAVGFVNIAQSDAYRYYATGEVPAYGPSDVSDTVYKKIWLMRYVQDIFDPQDELRKNIELAGFKKVGEHDFNRVIFWEYRRVDPTMEKELQ